jgi:hypothetical protein
MRFPWCPPRLPARWRHREPDSTPRRRFLGAGALALLSACATLPRPPVIAHEGVDFSTVPTSPPPAHPATIPARPAHAVWVDGDWGRDASAAGWHWREGGFVVLEDGEALAPWELRRDAAGALQYAPSLLCRTPVDGRHCVEAARRLHPTKEGVATTLPPAPVDSAALWVAPLGEDAGRP